MRRWREFDAITIAGTMQGGCRQLNLWKLLDRWCHGGADLLPSYPLHREVIDDAPIYRPIGGPDA